MGHPSSQEDGVRLHQSFLLLPFLWPLGLSAQGTFNVGFDRSAYFVLPNDNFSVTINISPQIPNGLFSYGVRMEFDPVKVRARSLEAIQVPPALNHNGVTGTGALTGASGGSIGVKGTVDITVVPIEFYSGTAIATFRITDLTGLPDGSYPLTLDFFNTLGPTESIFVDGLGNSLDDRIVFGSAVVFIVPEPSVLSVLALAAMCQLARVMRRTGQARAQRAAKSRNFVSLSD